MNSFIKDLERRDLIYQSTPGAEEAFNRKTTVYWGIDPTGDSLHVGHFLGVLLLKRVYEAGSNVIIIVGGGTAMIGDPSFKEEERPILPREIIEKNKEKLKAQLSRFFTFDLGVDGQRARMVDNAEWLEKVTLIEFLREAGKHISINTMIDKNSVKARIGRQEGMSYAEFSYQLLQAYDFLMLYKKYKCEVQIGGSDQWGNIVQGVELIRKRDGKEAYGLSYPLIVNPKTGKKFGKTEKGAGIWLDPEKTHPFAFYNFFVNVEDELAPLLMKYFSFKSFDKIEQSIKSWEESKHLRTLQKELAYELTAMVHGKDIADQSQKAAETLFEKGKESLTEEDLEFVKHSLPYTSIRSKGEMVLENILPILGLAASKSEVRRLIEQNGIVVDSISDKYFLIRKGKREYGIVEIV